MALRTPLSVTPHLYMGDSTGRPLDMGTVYFGEQDKDPEFYPINLFSDDALTKPLMQPVHTKGGYLYDKGDMVEPHAKELIYSVKVLDSYGRKVFYKGAMMRNSWNDDVIEQINTAIVGSADVARQVATDITNDAINNTAVEGGVLADTFVTVTANGVGAVPRSLRDVNSDKRSVKSFNVESSISNNQTTALQAYYNNHCVNGKVPYMYIPTFNDEYLMDSPLKMKNGGIQIYGDKGINYNKIHYGVGTYPANLGNIVVGGSHAFDLGDYRQHLDADAKGANGWTVRNLGFRQKDTLPSRSSDAIHITSLQDNPDRPFIFRELSVDAMNTAIYIPIDNRASSMAATMSIDNCNFSNCNYGIDFQGRVYGVSIRNSIIEQNKLGGIRGYFDNYLTIENCLLEGQPNAINLFHPVPHRNNLPLPQIRIINNYMEFQSGQYAINFNYPNSTAAKLEVMGTAGSVTNPAVTDFLRIEGARFLDLQYDATIYPVTLMYNSTIAPQSKFTNHAIPYFQVRKVGNQSGSNITMGATVFDSNYMNKPPRENSNVVYLRGGEGNYKSAPTVHGEMEYLPITINTGATIPVNAGDLLVINALIQIDAANFAGSEVSEMVFNLTDQSGSGICSWNNYQYIVGKLVGGMLLITLVGHSGKSATGVLFKMLEGTGKVVGKLFKATIENYGQFVNDGTQLINVYPACPKLKNNQIIYVTATDVLNVAAGASVKRTVSPTPKLNLASDIHLKYAGGESAAQYFKITGEVINSGGNVEITFTNKSGVELSLLSPRIKINVD